MILFINACVREASRTRRLAEHLLRKRSGPIQEVCLRDIAFPVADEAFLSLRDRLLREQRLDDPLFALARQFAQADEIIIAAPYWDLSFPAALKQYLEQVNVTGITFFYTPEGVPKGLCRAKKLIYVTSAGGNFVPEDYGFGYVKALAQAFWGIDDVRLLRAAGLDMDGADVEGILQAVEGAIDSTD